LYQIFFYVPKNFLDKVKNAVFDAGAGKYKNYSHCCWQTKGIGQFKSLKGSNPYKGKKNNIYKISEYRVELICQKNNIINIINALKKNHPYEEVAYGIIKLHKINL